MSPGAAATVARTVVRPVTVVAVAALATAVVAAAETAVDSAAIAADSVEAAADSVEVAAVLAPPVGKCSTLYAPNVVRKLRFPSSPAVPAPYTAVIASPPTARHVVAAAVVVDSATAVVAAIAVPAVTNR
jgi:hypothetical protein